MKIVSSLRESLDNDKLNGSVFGEQSHSFLDICENFIIFFSAVITETNSVEEHVGFIVPVDKINMLLRRDCFYITSLTDLFSCEAIDKGGFTHT